MKTQQTTAVQEMLDAVQVETKAATATRLRGADTNQELLENIGRLRRMNGRHSDGRGAFLGDGRAFVESVRAGDLMEFLNELLAYRTQIPDFKYNRETGIVEHK